MTTQQLQDLSQQITDLKALKDRSIIINGEGHAITQSITKATQSLFNVIEMSDNQPITNLSPTQVNGNDFTDAIFTQSDVQSYLQNYISTASDNVNYFAMEATFTLSSRLVVEFRIAQYLTSILDGANYN